MSTNTTLTIAPIAKSRVFMLRLRNNTSNLALFTDELPAMSFGSLGYSIYLSPSQVALDFGTSSRTYQMALSVFSQQPNILNGGGQLIVILLAAFYVFMNIVTDVIALLVSPRSRIAR